MNKLLAAVAIALTTGGWLSLPGAATAQSVPACEFVAIDDFIPVGVNYPLPQPEPARISGNEPGSQVNIRSGPGTEHTAIAAGVVGNYVDVIAQSLDNNCDTWVKVRMPDSGQEGWMHADYVSLTYGRGWWD
jgi:hypothetical protein